MHDARYAGKGAREKIAELRGDMQKLGADAHLITALDDIAWLLNIRGGDIPYLPVVMAHAIVFQTAFLLFVDRDKLGEEVQSHLLDAGVSVMPYGAVYDYLKNYHGDARTLLLSDRHVRQNLYALASEKFDLIDALSPIKRAKAVKNGAEIENAKKALLYDGAVLTEFIFWLKTHIGKMPMTEMSVKEELTRMRLLQPTPCVHRAGLSFDPICAYADNGAMVHYAVTEETDKTLEPRGFFLVDSGGQYHEGTTDVTRTIALGYLTDEEKRGFTLVLKGMLNLAWARFPQGMAGRDLDMLAHMPLWEYGVDYGHATGHGIGSFLSVHEGPNGFSRRNECAFEPGMITTDEPGLYVEGKFGVRIENELLCVPDGSGFLKFEIITLVPIDKDAIDINLLTSTDRSRLNAYHEMVYEKTAPLVSEKAREWLREATVPLPL